MVVSPMIDSNAFRVYTSNQVFPVGSALVITALDDSVSEHRRTEYYRFVLEWPKGVNFAGQAFRYNSLPANVVSNETLFEGVLGYAQANLDYFLYEKRSQQGAKALFSSHRFQLEHVDPQMILHYALTHNLRSQLNRIRLVTECKELRDYLTPLAKLRASMDELSAEEFSLD